MADTPLDRLKRMTAWEQDPTLSPDDLDRLLEQFAQADSVGLVSGDVGWIPTYNLRAAAREGWTVKMGRASELTSTDLDGDRMSANQVFEHCERMVRRYAGAASPTVGLRE